uniref:Coiled-coil domain-containing protein 180-like n=1 Tax=Phallusia mammillata TaxID=59560 RepID=A0A6F9D936_9ASCI|nr:coiled-coil domain-containing protein 180-like [Phallusia mammillata]
MAEIKMPVRVLQSGKVYRQMFDAEVQLMKKLESSKNNKPLASLHEPTENFSLPELPKNKTDHAMVSRQEGAASKLTANNILTDRQRTWKDGMPNDSVTENPVVYRQLTTEAAVKLQEKDVDIETREVRGLPNIIHVVKKDSDIIHRIAEKRKERHDKTLDEMHRDLSMISNRVEPRITSIGENLQKQLKDDDTEIEVTFSEIEDDDDLIHFTFDQLEDLWNRIESHSGIRREWIKNAGEWLNQVEDERLQAISGVLHKFTLKLEKVASQSKADIHRLIEKESMMINQSVLANRRAFAKLDTNLLESDIEREISQHMTWEERVKDWKKLNAEIAVKEFIFFMETDEILEPPEVKEVMESLLAEQRRLSNDRKEMLEQLKELKPPTSTKPSVYKWNSALSKANEELDKLHLKLVRSLHEKYETTCQLCLSEIEKYKQNLLSSKVCDEEDMRRIVNEHLLPMVGSRLRSFEKRLEEMDQMLESLATRTERQLKRLFKFAQGAAHLWDVHEIGLARQERILENELEHTRQLHDTDNQERETKLDVALDRLRQESTDEALSTCLDQCMEMLAHIKDGYKEFHVLQVQKTANYPSMVSEELTKYDETLCKFFNVDRTNPEAEEKRKRKRESDGDETELDKIVREILTTDKGTNFCVITQADLEDFEDAGAPSSDDEISKSTFLTELQGGSDPDKMPDYIKCVYLESSYVTDLKKTVRLNFLNHLEQWKEKASNNAHATSRSKQEELVSELDLRLHLHAPRAKRIEVDVRNVRAAELVLHKERVTRHCRGITAALATLKHEFSEMTKQHDEQAAKFKAQVESTEDVFLHANKSTKLVDLNTSLHKDLEGYVEDIKASLRRFRQKLDVTLSRLRTSNAQCVRAFKLFAEGGNFSPEETIPLRKKLEKMAQKVDISEGAIMKDLEGMESKRMDQATDVVNKFEDRFKSHLVDMTFIEKMKRWLTNSQTRIKTEVAYSNGMAVEVGSHLSTLRRRVDACERPNIDKESVTPELLRTYVDDVMQCLHKRALYLNCKKLPPLQSSDKNGQQHPESQISQRSDQLTPGPPLSAGIIPPTPLSAAKIRSVSPAGTKVPSKTTSRQGLDTQGSTYSRGGRQATEDAAIGVIKNILRAQKGMSGEFEDSRSIMTGTTRPPPSSSNSQIATTGRMHRTFQRQGTLVSIAGSLGESEAGKKTPSDGGTSGVYKRRETKFEAKHMIFGARPPEGTHFLAKTQQILYETLDGMLSTAEIFYKQKGSRQLTRPQLIQDNFDQCAEKVVEKLGGFQKQTQEFHNSSLQDFRNLLRELEEEMCHVPRLVLNDLLQQEMDDLNRGQNQIQDEFRSREKKWDEEKKSHKHELRPTMGHPDQEPSLLELSQRELDRQDRQVTGIEEHSRCKQENVRECASRFVDRITACSAQLLRQYDGLLTIDDVIVGRVPPRKELTSTLMRRRAEGVAMGDVADPTYGIKPIVERGPRQWKGLDFAILDLSRDVKSGSSERSQTPGDVVHTLSTTLPHTTVASERDAILHKYHDAHVRTLQRIRDSRTVSLQAESRWKTNWQDSIEHVRNLYR